jgi:hypothetical protein
MCKAHKRKEDVDEHDEYGYGFHGDFDLISEKLSVRANWYPHGTYGKSRSRSLRSFFSMGNRRQLSGCFSSIEQSIPLLRPSHLHEITGNPKPGGNKLRNPGRRRNGNAAWSEHTPDGRLSIPAPQLSPIKLPPIRWEAV